MIRFLAPVYSGIISLLLGYAVAKLKTARVQNKASSEALGALLRNAMFNIYSEYRDADAVPLAINEEMDSLHEAYHTLGYNHTGDTMWEAIMSKKIKD